MRPVEVEQQAAQEAFLRGYHGIPDDEKLQKMSFVELAALLSSCENGSARFLVVESEVNRRKNQVAIHDDLGKIPNPASNATADVTNKKMNPFATSHIKIFEAVVGALVFACIVYLIAQYFGLHLNP
jgi:hypothetical protein